MDSMKHGPMALPGKCTAHPADSLANRHSGQDRPHKAQSGKVERTDHGALAGDSGPRTAYTGGRGPIGGEPAKSKTKR